MWEAFGPTDETHASAATRRERQVDEFMRLFADAYTHEGLRETAWAGLNPLTEWYDHHSTTLASGEAAELRRAENAVLNPEFKTRARQIVLNSL